MDVTKLLKSSTGEMAAFTKRTAKKFAVASDLRTARDNCKTKEAQMLIDSVLFPIQKELRKECDAFDAKMTKIWKGTSPPADAQMKLDAELKKNAKTIESQGRVKTKPNSDPHHKQWINVLSF